MEATSPGVPPWTSPGHLHDEDARHLVVRCRAAGLAAAREVVRRSCRLAGLREDAEQVAVLLASEVVTNAVVHAETEARLSVLLADRRVHVEVADGSARTPSVLPWTVDGSSGRGMALVAALASCWGVSPTATGKVVWFDVADPEPSPPSGRGPVTPR